MHAKIPHTESKPHEEKECIENLRQIMRSAAQTAAITAPITGLSVPVIARIIAIKLENACQKRKSRDYKQHNVLFCAAEFHCTLKLFDCCFHFCSPFHTLWGMPYYTRRGIGCRWEIQICKKIPPKTAVNVYAVKF